MKTTPLLIPLLLGLSGTGLAQTGSPETVATVPTETGTEDICQAQDGTLYVTILQEKTIWKISDGGQVERFASLPDKAGIVGCAAYGDGLIIAVLAKPYLRPAADDAPPGRPNMDFSDVGPEILILDGTGQTVRRIPGQAGQMFSAVTMLETGQYLVAEALGSTIWELDPQTGSLEPWFQDDRLAPMAGGQPPFGMDGLAARDGVVIAGHISERAMYRIDTDADGRPVGQAVRLMQGEFIPNDFSVGPGGIAYATSGTSVFKLTPTGEVSEIATNVPNGGTGTVSNDGKWFYWPTRQGGIQEGTERVLRIPLD